MHLQHVLGRVNYLCTFIHNLSEETQNGQKLLLKVTEWQWTEVHEKKKSEL